MQKPAIPKGTRDFTPSEMLRREYIFNTIKTVFKKYGYAPIETPAMENLSTLLGKYGEEGDKLLFKILNSGDFLQKADNTMVANNDSTRFALQISEKGLRYDLTVPFARFVVQHRNEISFPFKRYQIQPVWRADRPQKGRYREFFQCDADVVGSDALINELELIQIIEEVFGLLKMEVTLKLNNRKILAGIAEMIGLPDRLTDITVAIDKIEKIGLEKVVEELLQKELPPDSVQKLIPFLNMQGDNTRKLQTLKNLLKESAIGSKGLEEIETVLFLSREVGVQLTIVFDLTLARGLNYYTGAIMEVKANDVAIGSICGGGRYDNLTGIFGMPDVSGVGISFGADRIYDVLNQLNLYPDHVETATRLLILCFGEKEQLHGLKLLQALRKAGVQAEIHPDLAKLKKQMTYANNRGIPFVLLVGEDEITSNTYTLKNMQSGDQSQLTLPGIIEKLNQNEDAI